MEITNKLLQFYLMVDLYCGYRENDESVTEKYINKMVDYAKDVGYAHLTVDDFLPYSNQVVTSIIVDGLVKTLSNDQLKAYHSFAYLNITKGSNDFEVEIDFIFNKLDTLTIDILKG